MKNNFTHKHLNPIKKGLIQNITKNSGKLIKWVFLFGFILVIQHSITSQTLFAPVEVNPYGITDVGEDAIPAFVDIDNDGDKDLFAGNETGDFLYFENLGTATEPSFATAQTNPFGLTKVGVGRSAPTFADIDGDGDQDMFSGDLNSKFRYFENTGTNSSPAFAAAVINPFGLSDLPQNNSRAKLLDFDTDGDLDLFATEISGNTFYYENIGTSIAPNFTTRQVNPFGIIDVGVDACHALSDWDHDGDFDIIIGRLDGSGILFPNLGDALNPSFNSIGKNKFGIRGTGTRLNFYPEFVDIDNDGDEDIMVGNKNGDFRFQEYCANYSNIDVQAIAGETYTSPSGKYIWSVAGTYYDTIPNSGGCDSMMTINLTLVEPLEQTLLAGYSLNNNFEDMSGNENHGAAANTSFVDDRCSNANSALSFDAASKSLVSLGTKVKPSDFPVSFSFWLKATDIQTQQWIFRSDVWGGGSRYAGIYIRLGNGSLQVSYGDKSGAGASSRRTFVTEVLTYDVNEWHHFAVNIKGKSDFEVFVDNVSIEGTYSGSANTIQHNTSSSAYLGIGTSQQDGLTGLLDEFMVYERALLPQEVTDLYNMDCLTTDTKNVEAQSTISLFPNPATSFITIQSNFDKAATIKIYSISGKLILAQNLPAAQEHIIDVSDLEKGMYLYQIENGKSIHTSKLMIE